MMRRRRVTRYAELTSLLDVLFILLFASLIQAAGMVEGAAENTQGAPEAASAADATADATSPADAGVTADVAPLTSHKVLRERALRGLMKSMTERRVIYARVSATGTLTAIENPEAGPSQNTILNAPLLEHVADPDVAVVYLGDRQKDLRLCTRVRVTLGLADLSRHLIVVAGEVPVAELPVALVEGIHRDIERCYLDERGVSALVTP